MQLPQFQVYKSYGSRNYGVNALMFTVDGRDFYFSYRTLVAFRGRDGQLRVRQNEWGPTTGKHLNAIDGGAKKGRLDVDAFQSAYRAEMALEG